MCEHCKKQLEEAVVIQQKFKKNQELLYLFVDQQEDLGSEILEKNDEIFFKSEFVEPSLDPFELLDVKTEEVVIKVECVEDESCVKPTKVNDSKAAVEKPASGKLFVEKHNLEAHLPNSNATEVSKIPPGYEQCGICKIVIKNSTHYSHVSIVSD